MAKVLGVGGIFFRSAEPTRLAKWYSTHLRLGLRSKTYKAFQPGRMPRKAFTVWSIFPRNTKYFTPSRKQFMVNLVVDNLEEALRQVRAGRARVVGKIEEYPYGRFGWFIDPDGNKVELWQLPAARRRTSRG
jgi:predicted enzyme related to lactoylglutathione lyase